MKINLSKISAGNARCLNYAEDGEAAKPTGNKGGACKNDGDKGFPTAGRHQGNCSVVNDGRLN